MGCRPDAPPLRRRAARLLPGGPLLVALLLPATVAADDIPRLTQYTDVLWQEKDGLPDDMVGAVLQTRDGYLWFGTLTGLARFDGVRFTVLDAQNAAAPLLHRVSCLYEGTDGSLWIGSRNGLTRHRAGRFESYPSPASGSGGVRQIVEDAGGRIWARTRNDLLRLEEDGLRVASSPVRHVERAPDGSLRVITPSGFGRLDGERVIQEQSAPPVLGETLPLGRLSSSVLEADGTRWLAGPWGLGRLTQGGQWTLYTRANGLPATSVTALGIDADGLVWAGTVQGIARFRKGRLQKDDGAHALARSRIQAIYTDREGSVWVGTDADGVHQLRRGPFTPVTTQEGLSDDLALPVLDTRDGAVWIGTARGLDRMKDGRIERVALGAAVSNEVVLSLAEGHDGTLWVGTSRGLIAYDVEGRRVSARTDVPQLQDRVTAIATPPDGSLWIGTDENGVYRVAGGGVQHWTRSQGLSNDHVSHLHVRPDASVWIATDRGITRWAGGQLTVFGLADGLPSSQVRSFYEAGESLWIGTYGGGLCRYRGGRFQKVDVRFPDNVVYTILDDGQGDLWMSSNRGIVRVARIALEAYADGRGPTPPFILYDTGDGLKTRTFVGNCQPAGWRARDGRLWFPTRRGAVSIDPREASRRAPPSDPFLENVEADGTLQPVGAAGVVAPPGRGELVFGYTAPTFRRAAALRFRYRLDGFDRDWQEVGTRRTAQYTNVPPGRYVFRVQSVSPEGVPSRGTAEVPVELLPHVYQTGWFAAACVAAALAVAGLLYRAKIRQVRERFALVLAERSRIAREMHDAVDQGFTAVTLQLNLCARLAGTGGDRGELKQHLDMAARLLEFTRSESKRSIADLRSHALDDGDLVSALADVAHQFRSADALSVDFAVRGRPRRLPGVIENDLLRIGQEAITNAVRHGKAERVDVTLTFSPQGVALGVRDGGAGFDVESAPTERDGHFGLMGIRERARRLGARLHLESAPGRGTEVRVEVPVAESAP